MFILVQRTDTLPEMRSLVNTDQIVAVLPVAGGVKTKLYLTTGESWEVALPFTRAIHLLQGSETAGPAAPVERI